MDFRILRLTEQLCSDGSEGVTCASGKAPSWIHFALWREKDVVQDTGLERELAPSATCVLCVHPAAEGARGDPHLTSEETEAVHWWVIQ